jgi:hypothetical protein
VSGKCDGRFSFIEVRDTLGMGPVETVNPDFIFKSTKRSCWSFGVCVSLVAKTQTGAPLGSRVTPLWNRLQAANRGFCRGSTGGR